jgi:hypothetical protein
MKEPQITTTTKIKAGMWWYTSVIPDEHKGSQSQKTMYHMVLFVYNDHIGKSIGTENRLVVAWGCGGKGRGVC